MQYFATAFQATTEVLLYLAGAATAIAIPLLILAAITGICAFAFDRITTAIGRRMRRRSKQPRTRVGKIIYEHGSRGV